MICSQTCEIALMTRTSMRGRRCFAHGLAVPQDRKIRCRRMGIHETLPKRDLGGRQQADKKGRIVAEWPFEEIGDQAFPSALTSPTSTATALTSSRRYDDEARGQCKSLVLLFSPDARLKGLGSP